MTYVVADRRRRRSNRGGSLLEVPGALLILLLFVFFPLLDLIAIGLKYGCCYTLNSIQVREASLVMASVAQDPNGPVKKGIPENWSTMGLGRFADLTSPAVTTVAYKDGSMGANGVQDKVVVVTTTCQLRPFLSVSNKFLPAIPGLNAPLEFTFVSERPMENPAYVNK